MEYPLVVERAGGIVVSVYYAAQKQRGNYSLCHSDFLLTSRGYKELRIL